MATKVAKKPVKTTKPAVKSKVVAVIEITPRQFLVKEGDVLVVNNLNLKDKEIITPNVLLTHNGEKTKVGQPYVKGAEVKLEHLETKKGKKIRVSRFKAKSRYRKVTGSRQLETHLKVKSIKI
jgi:large subunit ribosomal protein L21